MRETFRRAFTMRGMATFASGLVMSALLVLPVSIRAAELQPFVTLKTSSVNTLVSVAEKIAAMADAADSAEFQRILNEIKNVKGFNHNSIIGIAGVVDQDGGISTILLLPIADLWGVDIPSNPDIFDAIRPFLVRRGADRTDINSPLGTYVALQKQGYLVIAPEHVVAQLPADPRTLFADLEKYTVGIKLDLEKVEFETLEATLFAPLIMVAMMNNPEAGEQIETMVDMYRALFKEFSLLSGGITFNPQTADVELSGTVVPRKGSDFAKQLAGYKQQPTIFSGFRGTPGNIVLSFGDSATAPPLPNQNALMASNMQQYEAIFSGILEQIEMEDETGEASKTAQEAIDTILKIVNNELNRGSSDYAVSLNTDGTLLFAIDTVSLADIQKLAAMAVEFGNTKITADFEVKREYATIEGFKVSSAKIPVIATLFATLEQFAPVPNNNNNNNNNNILQAVRELALVVFWATKDSGGKQAIAVAVGLDFAKAESAFKLALEKTKTAAPVQKPMGMLSIDGLGKFLQQTVYPIVEKTGSAEEIAAWKTILDVLASAGSDATITLDADIKPDKTDAGYKISGKAIQAIVSAVKIMINETGGSNRPPMQEF